MTAEVATPEAHRGWRRAFVVVAVAVITLDVTTKLAASRWLDGRSLELPGPLDLQLSHNSGVAFGVGNSAPTWLVLIVTLAIVVGLAVAAWRGRFASAIGAGLVFGGATANIVDRLEGGSVVDMLDLGWWPTFNLADVGIVAGAALLMWAEMRRREPARNRPSPATTSGSRELTR